jgi:hypothetical protein
MADCLTSQRVHFPRRNHRCGRFEKYPTAPQGPRQGQRPSDERWGFHPRLRPHHRRLTARPRHAHPPVSRRQPSIRPREISPPSAPSPSTPSAASSPSRPAATNASPSTAPAPSSSSPAPWPTPNRISPPRTAARLPPCITEPCKSPRRSMGFLDHSDPAHGCGRRALRRN